MKTPYDVAMRVQRREIDAMGVAINVQINMLNQIETAREEVKSNMAKEAVVADMDPGMSSYAYMQRIRAEQDRLKRAEETQSDQLNTLRSRAVAAYGAFRAIELAAEGFKENAERQDANAEQARIDDSSATSFLKARQGARRAK